MGKIEYQKILLDNLFVNPDNYRFDPVEDENKAFSLMMDQEGESVFELIKSILDNGLNPSDLPIVVAHNKDNSKFIVHEGNRRITALKILNDVEILKDSENYNKVKKLIKQSVIPSHLFDVFCVVCENKKDSDYWIFVKHAGENNGIGTKKWKTTSIERFQLETGTKNPSLGYLVWKYYYSIKKPASSFEKFPLTTLHRIVNSAAGKEFYGITSVDNALSFKYDENETLIKIDYTVAKFLNDKITSRTINKSSDIQEFIEVIKALINTNAGVFNTSDKEQTIFLSDNALEKEIITTDYKEIIAQQNIANISPIISSNSTPHQKPCEDNNEDNTKGLSVIKKSGKKRPTPKKFFENLTWQSVDTSNTEYTGLIRIADELRKISKEDMYKNFPIATTILLRALIEQTLIYHLKKIDKWSKLASGYNGKTPPLEKIISYYNSDMNNIFLGEMNLQRTYSAFFKDNAATKDYFDMVIHNPHLVTADKDSLDSIANLGLFGFINECLNL